MQSETQNYDIQAQFMVELSNNFLKYYKKQNNKPTEFNMFHGIDPENDLSVNSQLESFYEEMIKYKMLSDSDKNVYKYSELPNFENDDELYCIQSNGEQLLLSKSLFSLLIELTNLQNENPKTQYDIICLS